MTDTEARDREIFYQETGVKPGAAILRAMSLAREEARREENERCAKIAHEHVREANNPYAFQAACQIERAIRAGSDTPQEEGWTDWHGGENPLAHDPEAAVDYRLRDGFTNSRSAAHLTWEWSEAHPEMDIIAYRIVSTKPEPSGFQPDPLSSLSLTEQRHHAKVREALAGAKSEGEKEIPETIYAAVERVLDENSAWIARPSPEVTKAVALAAGIAWSLHNKAQEPQSPPADHNKLAKVFEAAKKAASLMLHRPGCDFMERSGEPEDCFCGVREFREAISALEAKEKEIGG